MTEILASHLYAIASVMTEELLLNGQVAPMLAAFRGDRWVGTMMLRAAEDMNESAIEAGRWAFGIGAEQVVWGADVWVGGLTTLEDLNAPGYVRPADNPSSAQALFVAVVDAVTASDILAIPYGRDDTGQVHPLTPCHLDADIVVRRGHEGEPLGVLMDCLAGQHGWLPTSVATELGHGIRLASTDPREN